MKKISRIFICFFVYLICFININAENIETKVISFNLHESVIEKIINSVNFTATLEVTLEETGKDYYIELHEKKVDNFGGLNLINIKNKGGGESNGSKILFKKQNNMHVARFTIDGTIIFDWKEIEDSGHSIIRIGNVYNHKDKIGYVEINLKNYIKPLSFLKIKVKNNMDFGTIIAGQSALAKTPAEIVVEGIRDESIKIIIPSSVVITNEKNQNIDVTLFFKESSIVKSEKNILVKSIDKSIGNKNLGETEPVIIDGILKTKKDDSGIYKGTFTVRAEYVD